MRAQTIRFSELQAGDRITGLVCAWNCEAKRTKRDAPYLDLALRDSDQTLIPARMWDTGAEHAPECPVVVYIEGDVESFRNELQIKVHYLELTDDDVNSYVPTTYRAASELTDELTGLVDMIEDGELRRLVETCLEGSPSFWTAPSAIEFHGAYRGGLLEHTVNVTRLCLAAVDVYGNRVDQDLLLAAAVLHDIGKADAYETPENRQPRENERLIGHVVNGVMLVEQSARMLEYQGRVPLRDLLHALLSHHGEVEFGAPVPPGTVEAMILSGADRMEADVTGCFDHWRDQPGSDSWSYSRQRRRWVRRPVEGVDADEAVTDDLPF